jgi:Methylmalonic aciduria and homocystinuria type D protein
MSSEELAPAASTALPLKHQLSATTLLTNGVEYTVFSVPRSIKRDMQSVLPGVDVESLFIIPCCQRGAMDLVNLGSDVAAEKDRLLEVFAAFAGEVRSRLLEIAEGDASDAYWCDYVDPCSGLPVHTKNVTIIYPEVDTMELLLRYRTSAAGPCKILMHPKWGSHVYPATMFAIAPLDVLQRVCQEASDAMLKSSPTR